MAKQNTHVERFVVETIGVANVTTLNKAYAELNKRQQELIATGIKLSKTPQNIFKFSNTDLTTGKKIVEVYKEVGNTIRLVSSRISELTPKAQQHAKAIDQVTISWRGVARVIAGSLISRGVAELTNGIRDTITEAQEFTLQIGRIRTISRDAAQSTEQWSRQLFALSDAYGIDSADVATAAFQGLQNQIGKGADVAIVLEEALKLSDVAVSSTGEAFNALSSIIHSYNLNMSDAAEISGVLFKAVDLGRFTLKDIANEIGTVTIVGSDLGITYKEIFASLSVLTRQGIDASVGMTYLRGVMNKLLKPTKEMQEVFKSLGVTTGVQLLEINDFATALEKIRIKAQELGISFDDLFDEIRAGAGFRGLEPDALRKDLDILNNSTQELNATYTEFRENIAKKFRTEMVKTQNVFIKFGQDIIATTVNISDTIGGFSGKIQTALNALSVVVKIIAISIGASFAQAALIFVKSSGTIVTANTVMTASFLRLAAAIKANAAIIAFVIGVEIGNAINRMLEGLSDVGNKFGELTDEAVKLSNIRKSAFDTEIDSLVKKSTSGINTVIRKYKELQAAIQGNISKIFELAELQKKFNEDIVDREIDLLKREGKLFEARTLAIKEATKLEKELFEISRKSKIDDTDIKTFEAVHERAKNLLESMRGTADQQVAQIERSITDAEQKNGILTLRGRAQIEQGKAEIKIIRDDAEAFITQAERRLQELSKIAETKIGGNIEFAKPTIQKSLTEQKGQIDKSIESLEGLRDLLIKTGDTAKGKGTEVQAFLEKVTKSIDPFAEKLKSLDKSFLGINIISTTAGGESVEKIAKNLNILSEAAASPLTAENINNITKAISALILSFTNIKDLAGRGSSFDKFFTGFTLSEKDLQNVINRLEALKGLSEIAVKEIQAVDKAKAFQAEFEKRSSLTIEQAIGQIDSLIEKVNQSGGVFDQLREKGVGTAQQVGEVFRGIIADIERLYLQLTATYNAAAAAASNPPTPLPYSSAPFPGGSMFGKYITRQAGGSVGKDSSLILADPREFIMSAKNTAKFLPQLMAMNSGSRRFDTGGVVNNNNVGDINVTMTSSGTTRTDGRAVAEAIRRELRRKTARLN